MSTYTDLHNRIKENVTILRKPGSKDDGMSPQKVILINPENQFYGTFNGAMNIKGGTLSDLTLAGGTIDGATIKNATFLDGDTPVSIGEIASSVSDHEQRLSQAEADIKTISAAHAELSGDLSNAIGDLSSNINTKVDAAVSAIEKDISSISGDVNALSGDLGQLSGQVETLSARMLNGVVYRGKLTLAQGTYEYPGLLFSRQPDCCFLDGSQKPLTNGWMWRVQLDHTPGNVDKFYVTVNDPNTGTSCLIGDGDHIIIKSHLSGVYSVVPSREGMSLEDLDIVNAQDEDDAKLEILAQISSFLNTKIDTTSSELTSQIETTSSYLTSQIETTSSYLTSQIETISGDLYDTIRDVSSDITAQIDDLNERLESVSGDLYHEIELDRETIKEVSAQAILSANAYTNTQIESLSSTTSSLISTTSADTLAEANGHAEDYADGKIDELSGTVSSSLVSLSGDLSSYSDELCSSIVNEVDAKYVHKAGDSIANLSVDGKLDVGGKTTISNAFEVIDNFGSSVGSYAGISEQGIVFDTISGISLNAHAPIGISSTAPINELASRFRGTFKNGLELSSDGGLATLSVNGKSVQSTLDDLSNDLNQKKLDVDLARQLSSLLALSSDISWDLKDYTNSLGYLVSSDIGLRYDSDNEKIYLTVGGSHDVSYIDAHDFIVDGMLQSAEFLPGGHEPGGSSGPEIQLIFNVDAGSKILYIPVSGLVEYYHATGPGIKLSNDIKTFYLDFNDIKRTIGYDNLISDLFGTTYPLPSSPGVLCSLQSQINDEISNRETADGEVSDYCILVTQQISTILSDAISSKIVLDDKINNTSADVDLTIARVSKDQYDNLGIAPTLLSGSTLYIVESPLCIDAYNRQITNLLDGTTSSDAATVGQLCSAISATTPSQTIVQALSVLDNSPIAELSNGSSLGDVISSVITIRDALSALREALKNS